MQTEEIIAPLLSIRSSLFMWALSLADVDSLLQHVDYDTSSLPNYPEHSGTSDSKAYDLKSENQGAAMIMPVATTKRNKVTIVVTGEVGSGKSAMCGEIEILCKATGLEVEWIGGTDEKNLMGADWTAALAMYKPVVTIVEQIVKPEPADETQSLPAVPRGWEELIVALETDARLREKNARLRVDLQNIGTPAKTITTIEDRLWLVWPTGATEWFMTRDKVFAKSVFSESGPGNVIEYSRVEGHDGSFVPF
jgi:energy-coupling factor transporter ATP-binding protein EcfA2